MPQSYPVLVLTRNTDSKDLGAGMKPALHNEPCGYDAFVRLGGRARRLGHYQRKRRMKKIKNVRKVSRSSYRPV
jgi:hypothetical protein